MVVPNTVRDNIRNSALGEFDSVSHMAFSNDDNPESSSSDSLTGEFFRKALNNTQKNTGSDTYLFNAVLGLTEGNGNTLHKLGLMRDSSGDNLSLSKDLDTGIDKTSDRELNCGYKLTITVSDNT